MKNLFRYGFGNLVGVFMATIAIMQHHSLTLTIGYVLGFTLVISSTLVLFALPVYAMFEIFLEDFFLSETTDEIEEVESVKLLISDEVWVDRSLWSVEELAEWYLMDGKTERYQRIYNYTRNFAEKEILNMPYYKRRMMIESIMMYGSSHYKNQYKKYFDRKY